jgi:chromosome segregation ATPase
MTDYKQEQSRRLLAHQQAEQHQISSDDSINALKLQLTNLMERENFLLTETSSLQAKIEEMQRARREVEERLLHINSENSRLFTEIGALQSSNAHKSAEILDLEAQFSRMKTKFSNNLQSISETHQQEIDELSKEIDKLRTERQQLLDTKGSEHEISYEQLRMDVVRLKSDLQSTRSAEQSALDRAHQLEVQLQNERAEASALRLRLDLQREGGSLQAVESAEPQGLLFTKTASLHLHRFEEVGSPQFSDDFGPVSLPGSPLEHHNRAAMRRERSYSDETPRASAAGAGEVSAIAENNRLKNIIRDMRSDLEALQTQLLPGADASTSAADKNKIQVLEDRLKQSSEEISKLRAERRRLMDIGNEVRAELNQMKRDYADLRATIGGARNVSGGLSRVGENRANAAVSFAAANVDPWLNLPIRSESAIVQQKQTAVSHSDDLASSGEEIEISGNRLIGTTGNRIARSVLDKGKGPRSRTIVAKAAAPSAATSTTRKIMNYARAAGEESES